MYAAVWDVTANLIVSNDKELAILAIEVWNTIANEDKGESSAFQKKSLNIIGEVDKVLVPALLQNLLEGSKYEDDDEGGELNIISATKSCLISIAEATKDKFLDYAIKFVGSKYYVWIFVLKIISLSPQSKQSWIESWSYHLRLYVGWSKPTIFG